MVRSLFTVHICMYAARQGVNCILQWIGRHERIRWKFISNYNESNVINWTSIEFLVRPWSSNRNNCLHLWFCFVLMQKSLTFIGSKSFVTLFWMVNVSKYKILWRIHPVGYSSRSYVTLLHLTFVSCSCSSNLICLLLFSTFSSLCHHDVFESFSSADSKASLG